MLYQMMKIFCLLIIDSICLNAQGTLSATFPNEIPTNYSLSPMGYDNNCNGASSELSVTLPSGSGYNVVSVAVQYSMTASGAGDQTDQFSILEFVNTNVTESMEATNNVTTSGTYSYARTTTIANGLYSGGTLLRFRLRARRTVEGNPGCNTLSNKVDANSWQIIVTYKFNGGLGINTVENLKGKLDVNGAAGITSTVATFGSDGAGISVQNNSAAIGFNQYTDPYSLGGTSKYMADGEAALLYFNNITGTLSLDMYNAGNKDMPTAVPNRALTILNNGNVGFGSPGTNDISLTVGKGPGSTSSTANFDSYYGTNFNTIFNGGNNEDTYIRSANVPGERIEINPRETLQQQIGKAIFPNNTSIGSGGSDSPVLSMELFGGLQLSNNAQFDFCTSNLFIPNDYSRVVVERINANACGTNASILSLGDGVVQGQILLIEAFTNDPNVFHINEAPNIDLTGNLTLNHDDRLLLMWRIVNATTGRWTQISFINN